MLIWAFKNQKPQRYIEQFDVFVNSILNKASLLCKKLW